MDSSKFRGAAARRAVPAWEPVSATGDVMSGQDNQGPTYDRQLLLRGEKRNAVLELWYVQLCELRSWSSRATHAARSAGLPRSGR